MKSLQIINKMNEKEAVKLESQLVELANINDFSKLSATSESLLKKFNESYTNLEKTISPVITNGNQFLDVRSKAEAVNVELDRKFKEIGLDWKITPEYKKFIAIIASSREVQTMVSRVKNI